MTKFNINLAHGLVYSAKARRNISLLFSCYLLTCGLVLAFMCNRMVSYMVSVHQQESRVADLKKRFDATHGGAIEIRSYYDTTLKQLGAYEQQLQLLAEKTPQHQPVSRVLIELIEPLSIGMSLNEATYQQSTRLIQFSVSIPKAEASYSADQLISLWKKNPFIRSEVETITAVYSDRTVVHGREVNIVTFRCILKKKV